MIAAPSRSSRAFTLFEVLLALSLVAALSGSVFAFLWQVSSQKAAMTSRARAGQAGDMVLDRIEADLLSAVAVDSAGNPGIVGSSSSLRLLTRGVALPVHAGDSPWTPGDLQGSEYAFASGRLTARRWDAHRFRAGPSGEPETIHAGVAAFRLRFFDGTSWAESFNSKTSNGLPVAVEVAIWFGEPIIETAPISPEPSRAEDGDAPRLFSEQPEEPAPAPRPASPPDRLRVMVVADGPSTAWKELR